MGQKVVVIGGGTAGMSVLNGLCRRLGASSLTLIEPAEQHYYQPLWTLVGAGVVTLEQSVRPMAPLIPSGVRWIQDYVSEVRPDENKVVTQTGETVDYDYLVVSPGIQIDWGKIKGLPEALGKNGVCSNFSRETVDYTWELTKNFKGGTAIFTFPNTPIKCAGAPQKAMYLSEETFCKNGVRDNAEVWFVSAGAAIFGVDKYRKSLEKVIESRNIKTQYKSNLIVVDGPNRVATFQNVDSGKTFEKSFDMLHVSPPMSSPDFIKNSPLASADGWVDVDKHSLQHVRYPNVFSLGDASSAPNSKTGAAIRKQGPVLIKNLMALIDGRSFESSYDGYASCPLVTSRGKCIMAEFGYDGKIMETFPFDQSKESRSMYILKKDIIPFVYWNMMMKGRFGA